MSHEQSSSVDLGAEPQFAAAWDLVRAAALDAEAASATAAPAAFELGDNGHLRRVPIGDPSAAVVWRPGRGWTVAVPEADARHALIDLYLPICSATRDRPITVAHLGQSLDGFIATHSGDSQFVTGDENMRHMHRLRALCDAVIVGAGTVAADDPQLTTRQVSGASPLRVVIDPMRRLSDGYRVFQDGAAPTLYVCASRYLATGPSSVGQAELMDVGDGPQGLDLAEVMARLRQRGCARVFVEGGGVTVSAFLLSGLLDRLHVAVAPFFIGAGRPAVRLPAPDLLRECARPQHRVFRMGGDLLYDCDLRSDGGAAPDGPTGPAVSRVI